MNLDLNTLINVLQQTQQAQQTGGLPLAAGLAPHGSTMTMKQYRNWLWANNVQSVSVKGKVGGMLETIKSRSITLADAPMYGCSGLFSLCGPDDVIGLAMQDDPLVAWLGFFEDIYCERFVKALSYVDQAGTADGSVVGTIYGSPCDDPPTSEKGTCEYVVGDFGTLRGCGEGVNVTMIGERKCDKQPTYTLPIEGVGMVRIDNDLDLETIAGALMVKHEMSRLLITGDANVAYQFDGLTNIVQTGYVSTQGNRCEEMDSLVVDWANDNLDGLVNLHGNIVWKVRDMWRRIRWRIQQSSYGMPAEGDVVLLMPSWMAWAFLDAWAYATLWTGGAVGNQVFHDNLAMRAFRDSFNGGLYGGGFITIDGFNIHILPHDWQAIQQNAPYWCTDIYLLTRRLGGQRVLWGQYMPQNMGADAVRRVAGGTYYMAEQGGRFLRWVEYDNACVAPCILTRPRIMYTAPWAQGRIDNVCVTQQFTPLSVDPQSSYFIAADVEEAENIVQYWYDDEGWFH